MPENASRFAAELYDQFEEEPRVADWGGDELFTRMPRPRAVDTAPAPRYRPPLALVDPPEDRRRSSRGDDSSGPSDRRAAPAGDRSSSAGDRRRALGTAEEAMIERAERLGLALLDHTSESPGGSAPPGLETPAVATARADDDRTATVHRFDRSGSLVEPAPTGRRTKVITGRPDGTPRALPTVAAPRAARTPAEWVGPRPERIVGWAVVQGRLLILIAITSA